KRSVLLIGPGVVVAQGGQVFRASVPIDFPQEHTRVVGASNRTGFQWATETGECVDYALLDASRVSLLGGPALLEIEGREVEEPIALQRTAKREAGLRLPEGDCRPAAVGILRVRAPRIVL